MVKVQSLSPGDVLSFLADDNKYKAMICTSVHNNRSPQYCTFAATTYSSYNKPSLVDILHSDFYGVGNTKSEYFAYSESELENMWTVHPEVKPYFLGSYPFIIWKKDLRKFQINLELVGNLNIVRNVHLHGNSGVNASSWDFLRQFFTDTKLNTLLERGQRTYRLRSILIK
ncbi:MAG: hypothetical protein JO080_14850 [Mucilaginibacter sp.]|nr:hypothetical protein [Mucilaginibacter sp.]